MAETKFKLLRAPIVEAVLDIDCDMPPGRDIASLESAAHGPLRENYPEVRRIFVPTPQLVPQADKPPILSMQTVIHALQFMRQDQKQLVQFRAQGYSFNRLAPYGCLDDYLPEIERTWKLFVAVATPLQVRAVRLRYINRILLPYSTPRLKLEDYLKVGPRLPDEERLAFTGFLDQHTAVETETGNLVNIVLTTQIPEGDFLPLIFDVTVASNESTETENWPCLSGKIQVLRALKNRIFRNTLTEKCLNLFQQPSNSVA